MGLRKAPLAFTEEGVAMLLSVLNSKKAIEINILIMRAFVQLRKIFHENEILTYALQGLRKQVATNTHNIQWAFDLTSRYQLLSRIQREIKRFNGFSGLNPLNRLNGFFTRR